MNRRIYALTVLPLAALLLASCSNTGSGQLGNPKVSGMDATDARDMAGVYCKDIKAVGQKEATTRLATTMAAGDISQHNQDAIVDFAYNKLCPANF